jgi:hypothetical protein
VPGLSDTTHEKYAPPAGESTLYFADDTGTVFRMRMFREDDTLQVFLAEGVN